MIRFRDYLRKSLQNEEFRKEWDLLHRQDNIVEDVAQGGNTMSMKDKIRDAMTSRLKEASSIKYDSSTQPNLYELDNFLKKSGSKLVDVIDHEGSIELIIDPKYPGVYYPEISHEVEEGKFYTRVKERGWLEMSDLDMVMEGYETAKYVINHLESLDLSKLEI